jgi:AcrR family transcriptional regulator
MQPCGLNGRARKADARRQHLLETARTLFIEQGFHRTGMSQIAGASGIKVGQIYRDFASKEDIIAAIVAADVAAWLQEDLLADAVQAGDLDAIRTWITRFAAVKGCAEECRMMSEILAEAGRNPRIWDLYQDMDRRVRGSLNAALAALAPAPDQSAARDLLADVVLALGAGMKTRRLVRPELDATSLSGMLATMIDRELDVLTEGAPMSDRPVATA